MRLTNLEIYKSAQEKWDKSSNPHVSQTDFQRIYTEARNEWLALTDKDFEVTEKRRSDFRGFVFKSTFSGDKYSIPEEVLYIKSVASTFSFSCDGVTQQIKVPVDPRSWDEINEALRNPLQCPTDEEPNYVEYSEGSLNILEIYSKTAPTVTEVVFVKRPTNYDLISNPGGTTIENREQQENIIDIAVAKVKMKFGQQAAYGNYINSEIPRNE